MTPTQKHRLIGFAVIVSIAVIALPMLFDGAGYRQHERLEVDIPPEPEPLAYQTYAPENPRLADTSELPPPQQASAPDSSAAIRTPEPEPEVADSPQQAAEQQDAAATAKTEALSLEEKPSLDEQGVPVAWTLQLASFKDKNNASALNKRLQDKGYKAYIRHKDDLHKVFVGPDLQRSSIEQLKQDLQQEFKLSGLILRFTPN